MSPSRRASSRGVVLLPAPAGPSMATISPCLIRDSLVASAQRLQALEIARKGLLDAARVTDPHPGHLEADEREAHRHAVVVVGLDFSTVNRGGLDNETLIRFLHTHAEPRELPGA